MPNTKRKWTAFWICFFFGFLGGHYFYVGRVGMGLLYLFTGGLMFIGVFVDLIQIARGRFKTKYGVYLYR